MLHCNDENCAGDDESIVNLIPASGSYVPSLTLDSAGSPVMAYIYSGELGLVHCNDVNCAGGDDSIGIIDTVGVNLSVERSMSLALDSAGLPVIAYTDSGSGGTLRVAHCNDADCAGGDESMVTVDGAVGLQDPVMVLDATGRPVIAFYDAPNGRLALMHCNDADCAGDDETIRSSTWAERGRPWHWMPAGIQH